jgi:hypothetical protein
MQVRSWMATLVLATGSTVLLSVAARALKAGSDQTQQKAESQDSGKERDKDRENTKVQNKNPGAAKAHSVELNLMIAGLGRDGCEVEVKPGNRGCRFQAQRQHVGSQGKASFVFRDIELWGADRNCIFAITVRESGQAARTIYRGFRIASRTASGPSTPAVQSFTCFMNSPSKLAGLEWTDRTRQ